MSKEGEVEKKVKDLVAEVFRRYCNNDSQVNAEGVPYITKEEMKEFIKTIMDACEETESWDDH